MLKHSQKYSVLKISAGPLSLSPSFKRKWKWVSMSKSMGSQSDLFVPQTIESISYNYHVSH